MPFSYTVSIWPISISFLLPAPVKVQITMSAPAPRVVLRRSVLAPSAFSRASVKAAIFARPSTSPLPDSISTISCSVSISAGWAASAAAFSFSSGAASAGAAQARLSAKARMECAGVFIAVSLKHFSILARMERCPSRQKFQHDLAELLRRLLEHPVARIGNDNLSRIRNVRRQRMEDLRQQPLGVGATDKQRRHPDLFGVKPGIGRPVIPDLTDQGKGIVAQLLPRRLGQPRPGAVAF